MTRGTGTNRYLGRIWNGQGLRTGGMVRVRQDDWDLYHGLHFWQPQGLILPRQSQRFVRLMIMLSLDRLRVRGGC